MKKIISTIFFIFFATSVFSASMFSEMVFKSVEWVVRVAQSVASNSSKL